MTPIDLAATPLAPLASHLARRRPAVLACWRERANHDPDLPHEGDWTDAQIFDHFPDVLQGVEALIAAWPARSPALWEEQLRRAQAHAQYRWLQGFTLRTVAQEWGNLNHCVLGEIATFFEVAQPHARLIGDALQLWARVLDRHVAESVQAFHDLEQAEAATRAHQLSQTLSQFQTALAQRARAVESATRDIRGTLSVVQTSTGLIAEDGLTEQERGELRLMLRSGFQAVSEALSHLSTLAQLEAGNAVLDSGPVDASDVLSVTWAALQPALAARRIEADAEGPPVLSIHGDPTRIGQLLRHLVQAGADAAEGGAVSVRWGEDLRAPGRWFLSVAHTVTPEVPQESSPTASALSRATRTAHETEWAPDAGRAGPSRAAAAHAVVGSADIQIAIAKRLCELMHATLEIEETVDGLQYRVTFPMMGPSG